MERAASAIGKSRHMRWRQPAHTRARAHWPGATRRHVGAANRDVPGPRAGPGEYPAAALPEQLANRENVAHQAAGSARGDAHADQAIEPGILFRAGPESRGGAEAILGRGDSVAFEQSIAQGRGASKMPAHCA